MQQNYTVDQQKQETTRVLNSVKKFSLADTQNAQELGEAYYRLHTIKRAVETHMGKLKDALLNHKKDIHLPESKQKVQYQEGKEQSHIDIEALYNMLGKDMSKLLQLAKVSESDVRKAFSKQEAERIVANCKVIDGQGKPSVKVTNMTAEELKEHQ